MGAGQQSNPKVGFIIQARMKSTRLPGKVLLPLPLNGGKPVIRWIVDSARKSRFSHKVIVATSVDKENDPLFNYCVENNIECYRGDEDNVLSRFIEIIDQNDFDIVVRLTGDNPFVDTSLLDDVIVHHYQRQNDYTNTAGLPLGMNFEVVDPNALLGIAKRELTDPDREHVTFFIRRSSIFKTETKRLTFDLDISHWRLTIDYPTDFLVLNTLSTLIENDVKSDGLIYISQKYPWILDANASNQQKHQ